MDEYIVIGQTAKAFHPKIVLKTNDEDHARAKAHEMLRKTQCDAMVFNLNTGMCVLALTVEQPER